MLSYEDLLAVDPDALREVASGLRRGLGTLGAAEHGFDRHVVAPLRDRKHWRTATAGHAQAVAAVHQHAFTVACQELAAAARALDLFANDLAEMQTLMRKATSAAFAACVPVAGDGSTRLSVTTVTGGATERVDPSILAGRQAAQHTFTTQRDSVLALATRIDQGCAQILHTIAAGAEQVVIDSTNQQSNLAWNQDPKGLAKTELMLNVDEGAGQDKVFEEYARRSRQFMELMGATGETGKRIHTSVQNAKAFLDAHGDPQERAVAQRILDNWEGIDEHYSPHATEFTAKALPVLDLLFNIAKYSAQTHSTIEIGVKSGIATLSSTAGALGATSLGVGFCGMVNGVDGEAGFVPCAVLATFLGSILGDRAGGAVGDKVNEMLYHDEGTIPDPFLAEYKTTH